MINYIILGIVQGLTEFFPVSSSGHLVILQYLLGMTKNQVAISVVLHLGTGFALLVFFYRDIIRLLKDLKLLMLLSIVTIITVSIALLGKDFFEGLFSTPRPVALGFVITGIMLLATKKFMSGKKEELTIKDAVILGITQSVAIIPGISRSGTTISTLLFRKLDRNNSFRFAFLAAIPVIFGAALLESRKIEVAVKAEAGYLLVGFLASLFTGLFALRLLKLLLQRAKIYYFGYYCIIAGALTLIFIR